MNRIPYFGDEEGASAKTMRCHRHGNISEEGSEEEEEPGDDDIEKE